MPLKKFVSKKTQTELSLSPKLREYIRILNTMLRPVGKIECQQYANNVIEKIIEDYGHKGNLKQILLRFIGKVLQEQKEVLEALNNILKTL
jgi:hypothetical protein